jgi:NADPH:quinone reductase-like Zn-dependent oxidoreductase
MKAIVQPRYGPPESVELRDVPMPEPTDGEVLVRVHASSVNAADVETLRGFALVRMAAPLRPKHLIAGSDVAGVVERVGTGVTDLQLGDEVMGDLSEHGYGAFAEFVAAPPEALCRKPAAPTFEEAAAVPSAAWVAIKGIRDVRDLGPESRVLINGAGGGMGTFAVQMAKATGAEVTGVDSSNKLDLIRELGADHVIDFGMTDVTRAGKHYDLILDVFARRSIRDFAGILTPDGAYRMVGGSTFRILQGFALGALISRSSDQDLGMLYGWPHTRQDMQDVNELIESGAIRPAIDRVYPLEEVAAALRRLDDGDVSGKVVIGIREGT